jgi:hypothetical protein
VLLTTNKESRDRNEYLLLILICNVQWCGLFGKLFGSGEHAPVNIAGALILLGLVGMIVGPILPTAYGFSVADFEKALAALILASLTFLGGYLGGGNIGK